MQPDATALSATLRIAGVDATFEDAGALGISARIPAVLVGDALTALRDRDGFTCLMDVIGADMGERIEVTYHLRSYARDEDAYLKTDIAYDGELVSVWEIFESALFPERECAEMFGLTLSGHPNPKRLLTSDAVGAPLLLKSTPVRTQDEVHVRSPITRETYEPGAILFPEESAAAAAYAEATGRVAQVVHPNQALVDAALDADAEPTEDAAILPEGMLGVPMRLAGVRHAGEGVDGLSSEHLIVNMGPQHPSTHGVLHVMLELDGEEVKATELGLGFLHRGIEKLAEHRRYHQIQTLLDRADYLSGIHTGLAFAHATEQLLEVEVPRKALWLRSLLSELTRIGSHLVYYGTFGLDTGSMGQFLYAVREREKLLDILETITGGRMMFNYVRPGGVVDDLPLEAVEPLRDFVAKFDGFLAEYHELLTGNEIFQARVKGIGPVDRAMCMRYGLTGPVLRAAGFAWDLRKDRPYAAYPELDFDIPVGTTGDAWDRYMVRMEEMRVSNQLIGQLLDGMPEGEHMGTVPKVIRPAAGESYGYVESPRGEVGIHLYSDGSDKPYRMRLRPPTYFSLAAAEELVPGHLIADTVVILASFDIVMGEIDR